MTIADFEAGLDHVRQAPGDSGTLERIVARPANFERDTLEQGFLDLEVGLVGDNWATRGSRMREDGSSEVAVSLVPRTAFEVAAYLFNDLRVHQILEGTNEIMRVIIAREMLKS